MSERAAGWVFRQTRSQTLHLVATHLRVDHLGRIDLHVGYLLDFSCVVDGWVDPQRYMHLCYSDIPALYVDRGFAEGIIPYVQRGQTESILEYPVGTGIFMYIAALLTGLVSGFTLTVTAHFST